MPDGERLFRENHERHERPRRLPPASWFRGGSFGHPLRRLDNDRAQKITFYQRVKWWSQGESNPRPLECHSSALPTELWPLQGSGIRYQGSRKQTKAPALIPDAWQS